MSEKNLLILGASSDVGVTLIESVYNEFDMIIAHYFSDCSKIDALIAKHGNKIKKIQADFSEDTSVDNMITEIEKTNCNITHIVHLSALNVRNTKFKNIEWEMFENGFKVQVKSIFKVLNKFLPMMAKKKYGKVVFMLSSYTVNPTKYQSDYITIKYSLLGFMKALSEEYAEKNININAVSPSMMETKFLAEVPELIIEQNAINNPMKRNAKVEDVVPMIKMLLSDETDFITGQNILIAGGSK